MKKLFKVLALVGFIAAGAVACDSKDPINEPGDGLLKVDPAELEFTAAEGSKTVTVTGNNWKTTEDLDWITIEPAEGKFTVTVTANTAEEPRTGEITVANGEDSKAVTVTQAGVVPAVDETLTVDPDILQFIAQAESKTFLVTSELDWEVVSSEGDWFSYVESETGVTVTATANDTEEARTGSITVSNGVEAQDKTVALTQNPGQGNQGDGDVFTMASGAYWGWSPMVDITFDGKLNGVDCSLIVCLYIEDPADGSLALTEGDYTLDKAGTTPLTFDKMYLTFIGVNYNYVSGTFSVLRSGEDYVVDIDVELVEEGGSNTMTLDTTYTGAVAIDDYTR